MRRRSSPANLGPVEEIEPAALAADMIDQRIVAIGADVGGQADHRRVLRHEIGDAAHDERGAERHDEGRHLELGDDDAVDEADDRRAPDAGGEPDEDGRKERNAGIEGAAHRQRREDRSEAHHPSNREIDSGGDDDEGLAEPEKQHGDDRDQNVLGIADGEKIDRAARRQRHRDDEKEHHDAEENPCPDAAEEESRALRSRQHARRRGGVARRQPRGAFGHGDSSGCWARPPEREPSRAPAAPPTPEAYLPGT